MILSSRSFYPSHPPALNSKVDVTRTADFHMDCSPDILIAPSMLTTFAKVLASRASNVTPRSKWERR